MGAYQYLLAAVISVTLLQSSPGKDLEQNDSLDFWKRSAQQLDEPERMARQYYKILDHYYYLNYDSALLYAQRYIDASSSAGLTLWEGYGYYYIADIHTIFRPDSAYDASMDYLGVARTLNDSVWVADAYAYIAESYWLRGIRDSAMFYYQKGLGALEGSADTTYLSMYFNNYGYFLSFGDQQVEGLEYFIRALDLAYAVSDTIKIFSGYHNLAYYYDQIGEHSKAYFYYQESLRLLPDEVHIGELALTYYSLADLNLDFNNPELALDHLEKSKISNKYVYPRYDKTELLLNYADLHLQLEQLDSALYYLGEAERLLENYQNYILSGYYFQVMGMISQYEKRYSQSIRYFRESNLKFEESESAEPLERNYDLMASSYEAMGDFYNAYRFKLLSEELRKDFNYGRIAARLAQFEHEQQAERERERMRLEMDLEMKSLEAALLRDRANLRYALIAGIFLILLLVSSIIFYGVLRRKNRILEDQYIMISSQKDQLTTTIEKLEASEKQLKELNASKDKFFSIISHDLRNPLSAIIGLSELFLEEKELMQTKDLVPIIESMYSTANYGFNLLENLLEWARSQTGAIEPKPEKVSLEQLVANIKKDFQPITSSKGVNIVSDETPPPAVKADRNMIQTVLRNLIHNAIKYSHQDGSIRVHWRTEEGFLVTSVKDQGIGMSFEELSGVFNLDKKVQRLGTADEKGTGLGLILCHEFVAKNHGKIWAESAEGNGAVFYFSLPLMNGDADLDN